MYNLIFEPTAKPGELLPTSISVVCLIGGQNNLAATSLESLLLVRHHDGKWGLPSGRVEPGEEPKA
ncbi:MAG: hypothetical protein U9Q67_01150, partial [Patescibacteria group bacterium]|nr:hypothetical protein [Patescibacteria group bacterium]